MKKIKKRKIKVTITAILLTLFLGTLAIGFFGASTLPPITLEDAFRITRAIDDYRDDRTSAIDRAIAFLDIDLQFAGMWFSLCDMGTANANIGVTCLSRAKPPGGLQYHPDFGYITVVYHRKEFSLFFLSYIKERTVALMGRYPITGVGVNCSGNRVSIYVENEEYIPKVRRQLSRIVGFRERAVDFSVGSILLRPRYDCLYCALHEFDEKFDIDELYCVCRC